MAMGYFLLPLTMAFTGKFVFGEQMRPLQWLALLLAIAGVAIEVRSTGAFSWVTLLVCLGYPPYFILRRRLPLDTRLNFAAENLLLLPVGLIFVAMAAGNAEQLLPDRSYGLAWIFGAGVIGTIAMLMFVAASSRLSFTVFGLLGYLEPVLLMAVALFLLDESISDQKTVSYAMFSAAVVLVVGDSYLRWRRRALTG
jgi:chloramphenicol-sensitive protein RarD